jgi:hypothetical protein
MTKPLGYYLDPSTALDRLQETFGSQLEVFSLTEKLHLLGHSGRAPASHLRQGLRRAEEEYLLVDAYADHTFADENGKLTGACELLDGASTRDLRGLILALAHQIHSDR